MSAKFLKDLDDTRRRGRARHRPTRLRDRIARVFRHARERRHDARLRADPHLARDVGLMPDTPSPRRTR